MSDKTPAAGGSLSTAHISPFLQVVGGIEGGADKKGKKISKHLLDVLLSKPKRKRQDGDKENDGKPYVKIVRGGSILKASKNRTNERKGGGRRDKIKGFSRGSRRRLMSTIASIRLDAELPLFVTLTYPAVFPSPMEAKRHIDIFNKRMRREFPDCGLIWKLEPQERGAPHFHDMVWNVDAKRAQEFIPYAWFDIAGGGDELHLKFHLGLLGNGNEHCVQQVRTWKGVWNYASKYLGKTFEVAGWSNQWTGRFWSVVNRQNIPFGETELLDMTEKEIAQLMRLQKRFAGIKMGDRNSLTIFCNADQWTEKLSLKRHPEAP